MRRGSLVVLCVLALLVPATAAAGTFTMRGEVSRVVDGDTLDVTLARGGSTRVRLIGIDTPERGDCYADRATAEAQSLALGKRVVLRGDATQATRDRYGRLLAYVWLPGGRDLGYRLVDGGFGKVYVYDRPFRRLDAYRGAEDASRSAGRGLWGSCGREEEPARSCHPSYTPCVPDVSHDLDCADIGFTVRVVGPDEYRLDGDGDGYGCE
jgi:endonuclease YncB( thermonuclease family)